MPVCKVQCSPSVAGWIASHPHFHAGPWGAPWHMSCPAPCTRRVLVLWHLHSFSPCGLVPTGRTRQGILPVGDRQSWVQPASPGRQKLLDASPVYRLFGEPLAQTIAFFLLWSTHAARRCPHVLPPPPAVHPQAGGTLLPPCAAPARPSRVLQARVLSPPWGPCRCGWVGAVAGTPGSPCPTCYCGAGVRGAPGQGQPLQRQGRGRNCFPVPLSLILSPPPPKWCPKKGGDPAIFHYQTKFISGK